MAHEFNKTQKKKLKKIWEKYERYAGQEYLEKLKKLDKKKQLETQENLADNFVQELASFLNYCPKLITKNNKKIETEESHDFADVAKHCKKLLKALEKISDLDRLNILSVREERPEYGGRNLPICCDPLYYVKGMQEHAKVQSDQLKKCKKYERQYSRLREFITKEKRFLRLEEINNSDIIKIASVLWNGINDDGFNEDSFKKIYQPGKK